MNFFLFFFGTKSFRKPELETTLFWFLMSDIKDRGPSICHAWFIMTSLIYQFNKQNRKQKLKTSTQKKKNGIANCLLITNG